MNKFNFKDWYDKRIKKIIIQELPKKNSYISLIYNGNIVYAKYKGVDKYQNDYCIFKIKRTFLSTRNKFIHNINKIFNINISFLCGKNIENNIENNIELSIPKILCVRLNKNLYINFSTTSNITDYLYNIAINKQIDNIFDIPLQNLINVFL
jgi:hypothetical protein